MLLDEFCYPLLQPHWQAATNWSNCSVCRSFQSSEFVYQHKAQGLYIGAARRIGISNFGLDLECCVPKGLIEEKQARANCGAGDPRSRIEQIDIEVGNARQYPRRLPTVEPMPSRDKAQLAIELAQRRFWQAFDKRLAVMSFGPLVSDQQMSLCSKAVLDGAAPGNLYGICLDSSPIRQSAVNDIGWRNLNDRTMG